MNNILSLTRFDEKLKKKKWNLKQLADKYDEKYGTEEGKTIYNTLRNWHQGKGNPTLEKLIRICDILECDIDFLLGRMNESTHDIKFIHDKTGLSENSIQNLININHYSQKENITLLNLNYLLGENSEKGFNLLALTYHYLFGNYDRTLDGNDSITLMDKTGIAHNGVEIPISDLNDLFMPMIQGQLQRIKNDIQNQAKEWKNYGKYIPTEKDYKELLEATEMQNKRARKMIRKHKNNPDKQKFWDNIIKENNNELIEMRNKMDRYKASDTNQNI